MTPRTWAYGNVEGDNDQYDDPSAIVRTRASDSRASASRRTPATPTAERSASIFDASDVDVVVHQGEVVLTGTVPDRAQRDRAIRIAECVRGVIDVMNQMRVRDARR